MMRLRQIAIALFVLGVVVSAHANSMTLEPYSKWVAEAAYLLLVPVAVHGVALTFLAPLRPLIPGFFRSCGIAFCATAIWLPLVIRFRLANFDLTALICAAPILAAEICLVRFTSKKYDAKQVGWPNCVFSVLAAAMMAYYVGIRMSETSVLWVLVYS
jgi:hypothetical protein